MNVSTPSQTSSSAYSLEGPLTVAQQEVITPGALEFVAELARRFQPQCDALLERRKTRQHELDAGARPDFLAETREIRDGDWTVAPIPEDLLDRKVEITGPVDRKMVINALNSGANTYMADFEDSSSPKWEVMVQGQVNLRDAIRGDIDFTAANGKEYKLDNETATLLVRPRGWHMHERHLIVDGKPVPAGLFDFGIYFFNNVEALRAKGSAPYFYLPKMESHLEARLWNDVFVHAQQELGVPQGTIRATVLIETILAAFEMDEILWELRDHAGGLNCGRWDYIFSFIKCFRNHPEFVLPDRAQVTMATPFMDAYSQLVIKTCHRRGIHAIGGMAAQIPVKDDPEANTKAMDKVSADKDREARNGHDGSWVSHPAMVKIARDVFEQYMHGPNQIANKREDVAVTAEDLLRVPEGTITIAGFDGNINAALHYTESWISGRGAVPLFNLMEDAATAEISRAQLWQWISHPGGVLDSGERITVEMFRKHLTEELRSIEQQLGPEQYGERQYAAAAELLDKMVTSEKLPAFLTLEAYGLLT